MHASTCPNPLRSEGMPEDFDSPSNLRITGVNLIRKKYLPYLCVYITLAAKLLPVPYLSDTFIPEIQSNGDEPPILYFSAIDFGLKTGNTDGIG